MVFCNENAIYTVNGFYTCPSNWW